MFVWAFVRCKSIPSVYTQLFKSMSCRFYQHSNHSFQDFMPFLVKIVITMLASTLLTIWGYPTVTMQLSDIHVTVKRKRWNTALGKKMALGYMYVQVMVPIILAPKKKLISSIKKQLLVPKLPRTWQTRWIWKLRILKQLILKHHLFNPISIRLQQRMS